MTAAEMTALGRRIEALGSHLIFAAFKLPGSNGSGYAPEEIAACTDLANALDGLSGRSRSGTSRKGGRAAELRRWLSTRWIIAFRENMRLHGAALLKKYYTPEIVDSTFMRDNPLFSLRDSGR